MQCSGKCSKYRSKRQQQRHSGNGADCECKCGSCMYGKSVIYRALIDKSLLFWGTAAATVRRGLLAGVT